MYIGRNKDGTVYGAWTCKQPDDEYHPRIEEVADDHPDLVAFMKPKPVVSQPTIQDIIAVLPQASKDALAVNMDAKIALS